MANEVYANGREVSCKAADGKSICAFPDVCFTPPQTPATPPGVPIPYPNTAFAKDAASGSKKVKISGKEVMLKNKSHFKTSTGDEAGSAPKKGVITSKIKGKAYFNAWSMDVKIEGSNVVRHLDLTTHNHASQIGQTPPIAYLDRMSLMSVKECDEQREKVQDACDPPEEKAVCPDTAGYDAARSNQRDVQAQFPSGSPERAAAQAVVDYSLEQYANEIKENPCLRELRCALTTYSQGNSGACCPPQTPEHLVPASQFGAGRGAGHPVYSAGAAPCACAEGGATKATHGLLGGGRRAYMDDHDIPTNTNDPVWTLDDSAECGAQSAAEVLQCDAECLKAQLMEGHRRMDIDGSEPLSGKQSDDAAGLGGFGAEYVGGTYN